MIITNVCLLLEALSIVICLHHLYGEKFRLDIATVSFLSVNMIIMTIINYFEMPRVYTMIIYPVIVLYCGLRFEFQIKKIIINVILCIVLVGGIQLIVSIPCYYFLNIDNFNNVKLFVANGMALLVIVLVVPRCKVYRLSYFLKANGKKMLSLFLACITITVLFVFNYKKFKLVELNQGILLFASAILIITLLEQLSKYKVKTKEAETELRMHKLYADSFQGLIENIRMRQHEFDNHINAIYSQHYIYKTYEELKYAQDSYCQTIVRENNFNKLLTQGNPIIIGFLYGKFVDIDKKGIEVSYKIDIKDLDVGVPIYKLVEILGNLINNAVEALEKMEGANRFYLRIIELEEDFIIEVMNESPVINYEDISNFFLKGYSKKGEHRGLGLYNVKQICSEYKLDIVCSNIINNDINWISFKVTKKK